MITRRSIFGTVFSVIVFASIGFVLSARQARAVIPTPTAVPTSTTAPLPTPTARVCTVIDLYGDGSTTVNVRGRATMDSPVVDIVNGWDELTIYSRNGDWLGVITPNGVAGWVYRKWCEVEQ